MLNPAFPFSFQHSDFSIGLIMLGFFFWFFLILFIDASHQAHAKFRATLTPVQISKPAPALAGA